MARSPAEPPTSHLPSHTLGIGEALAASEPLALLARRVRESQDRLMAITPMLPLAMRAHVRAGPIDEAGWTLLAGSSAVAAKLRQMLPSLEAHLRTLGWNGPPLRVKLLSSR